MSKNIEQVFTANPITTNNADDLMYFGLSPYGSGDDAAMMFSDFSAQFTSSALTSAHIFVGSALNAATDVAMSGDVAISNTGATTVSKIGGVAISLAGSFTTSGAFSVTQTYTGITNVTFPTTGTLATTSQLPAGAALTRTDDTNVTLTLGGSPTTALLTAASITAGWTGTLAGTRGGTGVNNGASTITYAGNVTFSGAFTTTFTVTGNTSVTLPTSGTLATTGQVITNVNQNTSSATLAPNSRYATNNGASLVTYTLPAGAAVGDTYIIVGGSSGGWTIAQPASVQCHLGSSATTSGVGGSISSSNQYDCCTLSVVAANVISVYGVQGNLTIV